LDHYFLGFQGNGGVWRTNGRTCIFTPTVTRYQLRRTCIIPRSRSYRLS